MRDDYAFNIQFCELIENRAVIYDYNRPDYCNRHIQDQAWESIAKILNENVKDCKDRWKNIRNRYAKYNKLKLLPPGSAKTVKEYYLAPHLKFLSGFMKSRPPKTNLHIEETNDDIEEPMSPPQSPVPPLSPQVDNQPSPLSTDSGKKSRMPPLEDVNQPVFDYFTRKRRNCEKQTKPRIDTDLSFLQSMLYDMKAMNLAQKRKFKIGVMQLASQILDENTQTTTETNNISILSPSTLNRISHCD